MGDSYVETAPIPCGLAFRTIAAPAVPVGAFSVIGVLRLVAGFLSRIPMDVTTIIARCERSRTGVKLTSSLAGNTQRTGPHQK